MDTHGTASIYIAADSRITWDKRTFDHGKKVFAFRNSPDILGYAGDVMFPSIVVNQIVEMADGGLLFKDSFTPKEKFEAIKGKLISIFNRYPNDTATITHDNLQIMPCH